MWAGELAFDLHVGTRWQFRVVSVEEGISVPHELNTPAEEHGNATDQREELKWTLQMDYHNPSLCFSLRTQT